MAAPGVPHQLVGVPLAGFGPPSRRTRSSGRRGAPDVEPPRSSPAAHGEVIEIRRRLPVPREQLFRAWTDAGPLGVWFRPMRYTPVEVTSEARVGGERVMVFKHPDEILVLSGRYLEVEWPQKISWNESTQDERAGARESLVTVELADAGGSSDLILRHAGLADQEAADFYGWIWAACLEQLEGYVTR